MNFSQLIRDWYEINRRDLPWRRTTDPYRIWLSEVILQQTRIAQGTSYYHRFIEAFPDLAALASASEEDVLRLWQGLGYYSRARHLHTAARQVMENGGRFPDTYRGWLGLKGVGRYTAAAVASICFGEPVAVVDGNVARVVSRIFGVEEPVNGSAGARIIDGLARELMESGGTADPGTHNQAMMEFGALQCVPSSPDCAVCPLAGKCEALRTGQVGRLPVKRPKKKPENRWLYYFVLTGGGETVIRKREGEGIWRSLYQFPVVESAVPLPLEEVLRRRPWLPGEHPAEAEEISGVSPPFRHQLSHRTLEARFIRVETDPDALELAPGWVRVPTGSLSRYPFPRLIHRYLESVNF